MTSRVVSIQVKRYLLHVQTVLASTLVVAALAIAYSQTPTWTETDKSDLLHQISFKEFTLQGRFLVPPRQSNLAAPVLVLHCRPGGLHVHGKRGTSGYFVEGWIATGAVLNSAEPSAGPGAAKLVSVEFRLDDKKLQADFWPKSTDHSGVFLDDLRLDNLLYGGEPGGNLGTARGNLGNLGTARVFQSYLTSNKPGCAAGLAAAPATELLGGRPPA